MNLCALVTQTMYLPLLQYGGHTLAKGVHGLEESSNYRRFLELVKAVLAVLFALISVSVLTSLISLLFDSAEFNLKN